MSWSAVGREVWSDSGWLPLPDKGRKGPEQGIEPMHRLRVQPWQDVGCDRGAQLL